MAPLSFLATLAILAVSPLVNAHAYVDQVTIDGKSYKGWLPFSDPYEVPEPKSIVRRVASDSPILNINDPNLACNVNGQRGSALTADVRGGSKVTFKWNTWPSDHRGPVTVYMASCQGACTAFDANRARWFKIAEDGMHTQEHWATDKLIEQGASWTVSVPNSIATGEYLMRIELLALHNSDEPQFYPSCTQVRVTSGGSGRPASSEAVAIQDIYRGHRFPNIWSPVSGYSIAGPKIASFVRGGGPPPPAEDDKEDDKDDEDETPVQPPANPAKPPQPPAEDDKPSSADPPASQPTPPTSGHCKRRKRRALLADTVHQARQRSRRHSPWRSSHV